MRGVPFPSGFRLETLTKQHRRKGFASDQDLVDDWLATKALQNQDKHLSVTKVLLDESGEIAGYFTLATGQVDFGDLPSEAARKLPRRMLPVAILAWFGISKSRQGQGLGGCLLAQALRDCYDAGRTFAFIAVILDSVDEASKTFYEHYDFASLPGRPYRLFLSAKRLEAMMGGA
jgi:GNAT superfamily N-acetyltransferase